MVEIILGKPQVASEQRSLVHAGCTSQSLEFERRTHTHMMLPSLESERFGLLLMPTLHFVVEGSSTTISVGKFQISSPHGTNLATKH